MSIIDFDVLKTLLVALAGGAATFIVTKISNKTSYFSYHWFSNRIALSTNDSVFGDVRATWQGVEVRNLHMFVLEIENSTMLDYQSIEFKVYSVKETLILNEKTELIGTPYIVNWSAAYLARQNVPDKEQPTQTQLDEHHHNREYTVPVFNRGQRIRLSYLCTRPADDELPMLYLTTPSLGIKLKSIAGPTVTLNPIWGVPIQAAVFRAFFVCFIVVILSAIYIDSVLIASVVCMVVGLVGQIFGAALFKTERFLRNLIMG